MTDQYTAAEAGDYMRFRAAPGTITIELRSDGEDSAIILTHADIPWLIDAHDAAASKRRDGIEWVCRARPSLPYIAVRIGARGGRLAIRFEKAFGIAGVEGGWSGKDLKEIADAIAASGERKEPT